MNDRSWMIVTVGLFKISLIVCATAFAFMGFELFKVGYYQQGGGSSSPNSQLSSASGTKGKALTDPQGEVKMSWGKISILAKQLAPGVFFALFGAVVLGVTAWKGFSIEEYSNPPQQQAQTKPAMPNDIKIIIQAIAAGKDPSLPELTKVMLWMNHEELSGSSSALIPGKGPAISPTEMGARTIERGGGGIRIQASREEGSDDLAS